MGAGHYVYGILFTARFVKNRHARQARVIFLDGQIKVGNYLTDVFISVKEKEHLVLKDTNENIIPWIVNEPSNLT